MDKTAPYLLRFSIQDFIHQIPIPAHLTNHLAVTFVHFEYILSKILVSGILYLEKMIIGQSLV